MKNKVYKIISLLALSFLLCFGTYKLCYFIAETYFFDKIFYYKSVSRGYWVPGKALTYSDFGHRANDLIALDTSNQKVLGINSNNNIYQVIIIGDSYVWGQGIKDKERFSLILEKKLNKIRPTKIFSLGNSGDNLFDDYFKYKMSIQAFGESNLYIFAFLYNDFLIDNDDRYSTNTSIANFIESCPGKIIYDSDLPKDNSYIELLNSSMAPNSTNYCLYKKLLPFFPKKNSIYIDLGSIEQSTDYKKTFNKIISADFDVINISNNSNKMTSISKIETHASAKTNQIYADVLYNEITTNPKWGFTNE